MTGEKQDRPRRVVAIFNPASGHGDPVERRRQLESALLAEAAHAEIRETRVNESATVLAREAVAEGAEIVLVCGGDGTIMEVAAGLLNQPVALGVVPGGTGNLFATNLQLPTAIPEAVRVALHGQPRRLDVGRRQEAQPVGQSPGPLTDVMVLIAGIGWDARMIRDADRQQKRRFGLLAYFWAAIRNLRYRPARFLIELDDERPIYRRSPGILVANFGCITGGLPIVPNADPGDGRLDVAVLMAESLPGFVGLCVSALLRRLEEDPRIAYYPVRRVRITADHPQPIQFDGNDQGNDRVLALEVVPQALQVMVPRPGA
jgi:YegS/Rv2252/BmrU family lipid kinase